MGGVNKMVTEHQPQSVIDVLVKSIFRSAEIEFSKLYKIGLPIHVVIRPGGHNKIKEILFLVS